MSHQAVCTSGVQMHTSRILDFLREGLESAGFPGESSSPIIGSGRVLTRSMPFANFMAVDVGNAFEVEICRADAFSIVITADQNLFQYIQVGKFGLTLKVNLALAHNASLRCATLKAQITLPVLEALTLSGAVQGTIQGFKSAHDLHISISGASSLRGDIEAARAKVIVSGASEATLRGAGREGTLVATGASQLGFADFALDSADVDLRGASACTVNARSKLNYLLTGASRLVYLGHPTIGKQILSGASWTLQRT